MSEWTTPAHTFAHKPSLFALSLSLGEEQRQTLPKAKGLVPIKSLAQDEWLLKQYRTHNSTTTGTVSAVVK